MSQEQLDRTALNDTLCINAVIYAELSIAYATIEQLEAMLVMSYGGRAAEELIFGYDRVTTGAASDIQKATVIARRYVTQWGLSDAIGPILVGDNEQELFLGREIQHRREVSEQTAQLVYAEVKRVIDRSFERAKETLQENLGLLHQVVTLSYGAAPTWPARVW